MKCTSSLKSLNRKLRKFPGNSALIQYLDWLDNAFENRSELFIKEYEPIVKAEKPYRKTGAPFLSVVTRTQGKRPEMLKEALDSLSSQTDKDFEVVLVGHKLDESRQQIVENVISEQSAHMKNRIRFLKLDRGNRTAPLNFGFAHARGSFISILDDDDIVLENWVDEFHKAAKGSEGNVLHAYVIAQKWKVEECEGRTKTSRADDKELM